MCSGADAATPQQRDPEGGQDDHGQGGAAQGQDGLKRRRSGVSDTGFGGGPQTGGDEAVGGDAPVGQTGGACEVRSERAYHGKKTGEEDGSATVARHQRLGSPPGGARDTAAHTPRPQLGSEEPAGAVSEEIARHH